MICICGHDARDHRRNGACMAVVEVSIFVDENGRAVCPCNDFLPEPTP